MSKSAMTAALACAMFTAPFVILGMSFRALPAEMPVVTFGRSHTTFFAPKSLFMVFRVPLMNLTHGLMAAVMLSCAASFANVERRIAYARIFSTLLFTVAIKSVLEGLDIAAGTVAALLPYERWLKPLTLLCVLGGVALAAVRGDKVKLPWPELRVPLWKKAALAGLFTAYLAMVAATFWGSHRS